MSTATQPQSYAQDRLNLAVAAARAAGAETLRWFRQASLNVERKGDGSPVTAADRAAESLLRERISAAFPDDAILGEEFGEKSGDSPFRWVLDPIDGTKSFISGVPLYTTLVAVLEGERPLLGVIHAPATHETVFAVAGEPTWYVQGNAEPLPARVSSVERLSEATFVTTELKTFDRVAGSEGRSVFHQLEKACRLTRTWGDAYGYLLVATGRADVMIDPVVNLWDAAALQPVIEGAGGHYSDWQGRPSVHTGNAVATNPHLAGLVLSITRDGG
jgi:histidinol phosphatase-like enzyme (inositol monophosphatase family)